MLSGPTILDCTLRDGAYAIDYQFSADDTFVISRALQEAGFTLIEVGHGLGLGASRGASGKAAETDAAYIRAARSGADQSQIGMFCIPGIASIDDLKLAADLGLDFIRIGVNVTDLDPGEAFLQEANALGLTTSLNLMKSYAVSPHVFAMQAKKGELMGADIVCVVDSAGGMFPDQVAEYVQSAKAELFHASIGFHGHNNLQLAVANSIKAIQSGASIVDGSLQGMGRSAGNAQTEILVMTLKKIGCHLDIDPIRMMDLGQKVVRSVMNRAQGVDDIAVSTGIMQMHSSYLGLVEEVANTHGLDNRELILSLGNKASLHVTRELLEDSASKLVSKSSMPSQAALAHAPLPKTDLVAPSKKGLDTELESQLQALRSQSAKTGKATAFTISRSRRDNAQEPHFPFLRETGTHVVGNLEYPRVEVAEEALAFLDGKVEHIFIDSSVGPTESTHLSSLIEKSSSLLYSDQEANVCAATKMAASLAQRHGVRDIHIIGFSPRWSSMIYDLHERGYQLRVSGIGMDALPVQEIAETHQADMVIGCGHGASCVTSSHMEMVRFRGVLLDASLGSYHADALELAQKRGLRMYRVDLRAGLAAEIEATLTTHDLVENVAGHSLIDGVSVVAGGLIGRQGDVIVDDITNPTRTIGVADGVGGLQQSEGEALAVVRRALLRNRLRIGRVAQ
jgi:4-hydroxy-2-oxovalerate aldolase